MTRQVSSILVRAPNWIGDQIIALPFFHYLRKAYPSAQVTVACSRWVEDLQYRDLVDAVVVLPPAAGRSIAERWRALTRGIAAIRARAPKGFDLGIALPNSLSSAWLLHRAGTRRRRGYAADGRGWLLTESLPWDPAPNRHRAQAYVDLLPEDARPRRPVSEFWGIPSSDGLDDPIPGERASFEPSMSWPGARPMRAPQQPYWVLAPGSQAASRRWPVDRFAALACRIGERTGWQCIVVGSGADSEAAEFVRERMGGMAVKDLTGRGSVSELWRIFREARFTVSNDSGLAHVAALCGSPTQVIFGAGDPRRTRPLGPGPVSIRTNPVECWPCEKNTCLLKGDLNTQCLTGIEADGIWDDLRSGFGLPGGAREHDRD
ncbi:MAG: glycosyltransferase family 9 protein [Bdellovibrionales bacterium]|nr:glycosyltransferase family 9 protein [Bdellovibrionales bacterium]